MVITADHGLVNIPEERRIILSEKDPLNGHLRCLPTGEPMVPIFHTLPGHEEGFAMEFRERFGEHYALLTPEE